MQSSQFVSSLQDLRDEKMCVSRLIRVCVLVWDRACTRVGMCVWTYRSGRPRENS